MKYLENEHGIPSKSGQWIQLKNEHRVQFKNENIIQMMNEHGIQLNEHWIQSQNEHCHEWKKLNKIRYNVFCLMSYLCHSIKNEINPGLFCCSLLSSVCILCVQHLGIGCRGEEREELGGRKSLCTYFLRKKITKKGKQKDGSETKMIASFLKQDLNTQTVGKKH